MEFDEEKEKEKWILSEEEFNENMNEIFAELSLYAEKQVNPSFILVGGQAGSGKTALVSREYRDLRGRRNYH